MDELIAEFLLHTCTPEYSHEAYRSFKIFADFEYPDVFSSFIDILTNESFTTSEQLRDEFHSELHKKLNYILEQHNLKLISTASIRQKNEFLTALYMLQGLEDYSPVIAVLESLETDEVKLTSILEDYCQLDMTEQLTLIADFSPITLDRLKDYIEQQATIKAEQAEYRDLIPPLKAFFKLFGKNNIGYVLIDNDVKPGQPLETYLGYIDNIVASSIDQTALNVLSLIYLTKESLRSPLTVFNQHSLQMLKELTLVSKVEPLLIRMTAKVDELLKAQQQVQK